MKPASSCSSCRLTEETWLKERYIRHVVLSFTKLSFSSSDITPPLLPGLRDCSWKVDYQFVRSCRLAHDHNYCRARARREYSALRTLQQWPYVLVPLWCVISCVGVLGITRCCISHHTLLSRRIRGHGVQENHLLSWSSRQYGGLWSSSHWGW